jgi:hypothetical protein
MHGPWGETDLVELSFESEVVAGGLPPAALSRLARQCWSFNTRMRLTGELEYRDGRFRAVIEGACAIVQPLAARIFCDRRHGLIRIVAFRPLPARRHPGWALAGFDLEDALLRHDDRSAPNVRVLPLGARQRPLDLPARAAAAGPL